MPAVLSKLSSKPSQSKETKSNAILSETAIIHTIKQAQTLNSTGQKKFLENALDSAAFHYLEAAKTFMKLPADYHAQLSISINGVDKLAGNIFSMLAKCYTKLNKDLTSAKQFAKAAQCYQPNNWDYYEITIIILTIEKDMQGILNFLSPLLCDKTDRKIAKAAATEIFQLYRSGDVQPDTQLLKRVFSLINLEDPKTRIIYINFLFSENDTAKAKKEIEDTIKTAKNKKNIPASALGELYHNLAFIYYKNGRGRDVQLMLDYFRASATYGCARAQYFLARYFDYDSAQPNLKTSLQYYNMAVTQGEVEALYNYAYKLLTGEGIPQDIPQGKALLLRAESTLKTLEDTEIYKDCIPRIFLELGIIYATEADYKKAEAYCRLSVQHGNPEAKTNIVDIYLKQERYAEAFSELAAYLKCCKTVPAKVDLLFAMLLSNNYPGIPINIPKANTRLINLAKCGESMAISQLALNHHTHGLPNQETLLEAVKTATAWQNKQCDEGADVDLIQLQSGLETRQFSEKQDTLQAEGAFRHTQNDIHFLCTANGSPTSRTSALLTLMASADMDQRNFATIVHRVGKCMLETNFKTGEKLNAILERYHQVAIEKRRVAFIFDKTSVLKILQGISHLQVSLEHPALKPLMLNTLKQTHQLVENCSLDELILLLYYMTRLLPYKDKDMLTTLKTLIAFTISRQASDPETEKTPLLLQCLSILHAYDKTLLEPKNVETIATTVEKKATHLSERRQQQQAYLGLLYFSTILKGMIKSATLNTLEKSLLEPAQLTTKESNLQKRLTQILKRKYKDLRPEHPINTLPTDIYLPSLDMAVQIHGPTHFQFDGNAYQLTAWDNFLTGIIRQNCENVVILPFYEAAEKTPAEEERWVHQKIADSISTKAARKVGLSAQTEKNSTPSDNENGARPDCLP